MKKQNKELLDKVIEMKLKRVLDNPDDNRDDLEDALDAIDRQNDYKKNRNDKLIKAIEIGATIAVIPVIEAAAKMAFAKTICDFEREDMFTTTAGKSLTSLFRFK